jgi:hypothetical protein
LAEARFSKHHHCKHPPHLCSGTTLRESRHPPRGS